MLRFAHQTLQYDADAADMPAERVEENACEVAAYSVVLCFGFSTTKAICLSFNS